MIENCSSQIRRHFGVVLLLSALDILLRFLSFTLPIATMLLINGGVSRERLVFVLLLVLGSFLVNLMTIKVQKKVSFVYRSKLNMDMYEELFRVEYPKLNEKSIPYYLERINLAVAHYSSFLLYSVPNLVSLVATIVLALVLIGRAYVVVSVAILAVFCVQFVGYGFINRRLKEKAVALQATCASSFSNILSVLGCVDFIKSLSCFDGVSKVLRKDVEEIHRSNVNVDTYAKLVGNTLSILIANLQYTIYVLLGFLVLNELDASKFIFSIMLTNICFSSFSELIRVNMGLKDVKASQDFICRELRDCAERDEGEALESIESITFEDSDIGYEGKPLVSGMNARIERGDIVFLKGMTGTGKSTLAKSLVGFVPIEGLKFNDIDAQRFRIDSVRDRIAYVSQSSAIINGGIEDNILMGASKSKTKDVLGKGFLSKFVDKGLFKDGTVTSSGSNLSGGDKQKVSVARLFLRNPDVVILDEATSSMDEETARHVYEEVLSCFGDRIVIIISHSGFVADYATRVFEIEDGKLVERV